jgi:hypothetical protein
MPYTANKSVSSEPQVEPTTQHEAVVDIPEDVVHESELEEAPVIEESASHPDPIAHETVPTEVSEEAVSNENLEKPGISFYSPALRL